MIQNIIAFVGLLVFCAFVIGLFLQAWDYDKRDNIEVGHFEKYGELWIATHVSKRNGKVVYRNSTVGEGVASVGKWLD